MIDKWNAKTVAAELSKRGMTPVADNKGAFESFRVKDPDGWDLQICNNKGLSAARKKPATAILSAPAPFGPTGWKTVWLDHFSFRVSNYKQSASYYSNLLGWKRTYDEGTQNELEVGNVGDVLCRGGNPYVPAQANGPKGASIDHISFGITPWDVEAVRAALESRGLKVSDRYLRRAYRPGQQDHQRRRLSGGVPELSHRNAQRFQPADQLEHD